MLVGRIGRRQIGDMCASRTILLGPQSRLSPQAPALESTKSSIHQRYAAPDHSGPESRVVAGAVPRYSGPSMKLWKPQRRRFGKVEHGPSLYSLHRVQDSPVQPFWAPRARSGVEQNPGKPASASGSLWDGLSGSRGSGRPARGLCGRDRGQAACMAASPLTILDRGVRRSSIAAPTRAGLREDTGSTPHRARIQSVRQRLERD